MRYTLRSDGYATFKKTTLEDRWAALDKIFGPAPKKGDA